MIIWFSGTGNSRMVATMLREKLGGESVELSGERLLNPHEQLLEVAPGEIVVWVFPIYCWGVPPVVKRFINKVRFRGAEQARHYMVCTCGDDIGRADDMWRHHLGRRGWTPRGAFSVQAPNNYVGMKGFDVDTSEVADAKLAAIPARVADITAKIQRGFADADVVRGSWAWLKTNIVYWWFMANKMSPLPFRADPEKCTSCGKCSRNCPMNDITMTDGHPSWGPTCAMCLRCYHACPTRAIAYGRFTAGKGQYINPLPHHHHAEGVSPKSAQIATDI